MRRARAENLFALKVTLCAQTIDLTRLQGHVWSGCSARGIRLINRVRYKKFAKQNINIKLNKKKEVGFVTY